MKLPWILVPILLVAIVDLWIVSAGRWWNWPQYTALNDMQADAFVHGQTSLLAQPKPELLALPNPYDAKANRDLRLHDAVLFQGKYYLYWGPLPAMLLAAVKLVAPGVVVGDQHLAFVFAIAGVCVSAILLRFIRERWFGDTPRWTLWAAILLAGLVTPMPFLLARASAYEVAILAGQFFLLSGIALALGAKDRQERAGRMLITCGICWGAALASRISLAPFVAVLCLAIVSRRRDWISFLRTSTPVGIAVLGLAIYNHARFGSIHESGVKYMLASNSAQRAILSGHMFGMQYAPANLVNYLLTPPVVTPTFPFVEAKVYGLGLLRRIYEPRYYHVNTVSGLVPTAPILLLAIVPPVMWIRRRRSTHEAVVLAAVGIIAATAPVIFLYNCTMRYQADWVPMLVILAVVGWWMLDRKGWMRFAVTAAIIYTCILGILLGVTGYSDHFKTNNPVLYEHLQQLRS
jgi:hypothetical protein